MTWCATCQQFDLHAFTRDPNRTRGYRLRTIEKGVRQDCEFCTLLSTSLAEHIDAAKKKFKGDCWVHMTISGSSPYVSSTIHINGASGLAFNRLYTWFGPRAVMTIAENFDRAIRPTGCELCIAADPDSDAAQSGDVLGRYLGNDPRSSDHFDQIQTWLQTCIDHAQCNQTASGQAALDFVNAPLPTRCIDIRGGQLVLREITNQTGCYVTLSHRWNTESERAKTTTTNYEARKNSFEVDELGQTFQDAVHVVRELNSRLEGFQIEYLWIDSICIIQAGDEFADWRAEAPKMGKYYQNSLMTIAATSASTGGDGDRGLFSLRPDVPKALARLPYHDPNGERRGHFYVYSTPQTINREYTSSVRNSPLLRRGWVFQEWILSRRVVHFSKTKIFFECMTNDPQNECQEMVDEKKEMVNNDQAAIKAFFQHQDGPVEDLWYRVVRIYSGLALTFPEKDRIIAISGVANELKKMLASKYNSHVDMGVSANPSYIAGLWLEDLHHGLLWEQATRRPIAPSCCGTPTWSWASYLTPVRWQMHDSTTQNSCTFVQLTTDGPSTHAIHRHGDFDTTTDDIDSSAVTLKMTGRLKPLTVGQRLNGPIINEIAQATGYQLSKRDPRTNWRAIADADLDTETIIGWASFEVPDPPPSIPPESSDSKPESSVLALQISTLPRVPGGIAFGLLGLTHEVSNILLVRSNDNGKTFRRVGVGRVFKQRFFDGVVETGFELV